MGQERKLEYRAHSASVPIVADDEGVFEGHIVVWDEVDSYNSMFKRGAFKKTLRERADKVVALYNHGDAIGKLIEAREDDIGVFIRAKLTMEVAKAKEAYALMRDEVITALSFGFATIRDSRDPTTGLRTISEVMLFEISPVLFPANENSRITSVRATDFNETAREKILERDGWLLLDSLHRTLMDLWWENKPVADFDLALDAFHAAYLAWVVAVRDDAVSRQLDAAESLRAAIKDPLIYATRQAIGGHALNEIASRTSLTIDDLEALRGGVLLPLSARRKLPELSPEVVAAHAELRAKKIHDLCTELRAGGLTHAEQVRLQALISQSSPRVCATSPAQPLDTGSAAKALAEINQLLGASNGD